MFKKFISLVLAIFLIAPNAFAMQGGFAPGLTSTPGLHSGCTLSVAAPNSTWAYSADFISNGPAANIAIQAAINAMPTTGGKIVLFEGQYNIAATINLYRTTTEPIRLWIQGMGGLSTILKLTNNSSHDMFEFADATSEEAIGLYLDSFYANGNKQGGATGAFFNSKTSTGEIKDVYIENCFIGYSGSTGAALTITNPWGWRIVKTIFEFNEGDAINVFPGTVLGSKKSLFMTNCKIRSNKGNGLVLNGVDNCQLLGNEFDSGAGGNTAAWDIKLINSEGNYIQGVFEHTGTDLGSCISIDGDSHQNQIVGQFNGGTVSANGVVIASGALRNTISSCSFANFTTAEISDSGIDTLKFGNQSATASTRLSSLPGGGYTKQISANTINPADGTTYYIGSMPVLGPQTTAAVLRIYIPTTGTIKEARISFNNAGTLGTTETSTVSIRLNNTTDTTLSAVVTNDAAYTTFVNTALSIAVVAEDYIEFKWVTPNWVTNPTSVYISGSIYIE